MYVSLEAQSCEKNDWQPVAPYLLWLSNDKKSGDFYLKIDRKSLFVSSYQDGMSPHPLLKAMDILFKSHFVFNCRYHDYLLNFYSFLESIHGLTVGNSPTVQKFKNSLREEEKKMAT